MQPERLKSTQRFAIDVWNVTKRWEELAARAHGEVKRFVVGRMKCADGRGKTAGDEGHLSVEDRDRTMAEVVRAHDELAETLEDLDRQIGKLRTAQGRIGAMKKLCEPSFFGSPSTSSHSGSPTPTRAPSTSTTALSPTVTSSPGSLERRGSPQSLAILTHIEKSLPDVIRMFERELECKREAVRELGESEHRGLSNAVIVSFHHEPFVDDCVLNELYAAIALAPEA